jgi:hypothetical protein
MAEQATGVLGRCTENLALGADPPRPPEYDGCGGFGGDGDICTGCGCHQTFHMQPFLATPVANHLAPDAAAIQTGESLKSLMLPSVEGLKASTALHVRIA